MSTDRQVLFPLKADKSPAVPRGTDWRDYAGKVSTPIYGIAIKDGSIVFDLDTYKGVTTGDVDSAIGCELDWDGALLQHTRNGGSHYGFTVPKGINLINSSDVLGVVGFDTRSAGKGYIATGEGYTDETMLGIVDSLNVEGYLPELPGRAIELLTGSGARLKNDDADSDLMSIIAAEPLDISRADVEAYLAKLTPEQVTHRETWLDVMMGINHQFGASEEGWEIADKVSRLYPKGYNEYQNRKAWDSIDSDRPNRITFATIIKMVGGKHIVPEDDELDALLLRTDNIESHEEYEALKTEIVSNTTYPKDVREMLAKSMHTSYGKKVGVSITTLRKAITPTAGGLVKKSGLFKNWAFVEAQNKYYDLRRGVAIGAQAFRVKFDGHEVVVASEMDAVTFASQNGITTVYDVMFWPGEDIVFEYEGLAYVNGYRANPKPVPLVLNKAQQKAVDLCDQHLKFLFPNKADRIIVEDWMAYIVQNVGERVGWAIVVKGTEGDGKTFLSEMMRAVTGSVNQVSGASFGGQFNEWAQGAVVITIEEIRVPGDKKHESLDRTKPYITNTIIAVEGKGRNLRNVVNHSSYLLFTNHADALPLSKSDRRYCVMESPHGNEEQLFKALGGQDASAKYFEDLFIALETYPEAFAYKLHNHKVSESFKPKGRAPSTEAKVRMLDATVSGTQVMVEDAIDKHECATINNDLIDVTQLHSLCVDGFGNVQTQLPKSSALSNTLRDMGYVQIDKRRAKIGGKLNHTIWYKPDVYDSDSAIAKVRFEFDADDIGF